MTIFWQDGLDSEALNSSPPFNGFKDTPWNKHTGGATSVAAGSDGGKALRSYGPSGLSGSQRAEEEPTWVPTLGTTTYIGFDLQVNGDSASWSLGWQGKRGGKGNGTMGLGVDNRGDNQLTVEGGSSKLGLGAIVKGAWTRVVLGVYWHRTNGHVEAWRGGVYQGKVAPWVSKDTSSDGPGTFGSTFPAESTTNVYLKFGVYRNSGQSTSMDLRYQNMVVASTMAEADSAITSGGSGGGGTAVVLPAPPAISLVSNVDQVKFSIAPVVGARTGDLIQVYREDTSANIDAELPINATEYTDTGVVVGQEYRYRVSVGSAANGYGAWTADGDRVITTVTATSTSTSTGTAIVADFDGATSEAVLTPAPDLTGAFFMLAGFRRDVDAGNQTLLSLLNADDTMRFGFGLWAANSSTAGVQLRYDNGAGETGGRTQVAGLTWYTADGWGLLGVGKDSGTVPPRLHGLKAAAWTHQAWGLNINDDAVVAGGKVAIGRRTPVAPDRLNGKEAFVALWLGVNPVDATVETYDGLDQAGFLALPVPPTHFLVPRDSAGAVVWEDQIGTLAQQSAAGMTIETVDLPPASVYTATGPAVAAPPVAPSITWITTPPNPSTSASASFTWDYQGDPPTLYESELVANGVAQARQPLGTVVEAHAFEDLPNGEYEFRIYAENAAVTAPVVTTYAWTVAVPVERPAPNPPVQTGSGDKSVTFTWADPPAEFDATADSFQFYVNDVYLTGQDAPPLARERTITDPGWINDVPVDIRMSYGPTGSTDPAAFSGWSQPVAMTPRPQPASGAVFLFTPARVDIGAAAAAGTFPVEIRVTGSRQRTFQIVENYDWVTVSPTTGMTPAVVDVTVARSGLSRGKHVALVDVIATDGT